MNALKRLESAVKTKNAAEARAALAELASLDVAVGLEKRDEDGLPCLLVRHFSQDVMDAVWPAIEARWPRLFDNAALARSLLLAVPAGGSNTDGALAWLHKQAEKASSDSFLFGHVYGVCIALETSWDRSDSQEEIDLRGALARTGWAHLKRVMELGAIGGRCRQRLLRNIGLVAMTGRDRDGFAMLRDSGLGFEFFKELFSTAGLERMRENVLTTLEGLSELDIKLAQQAGEAQQSIRFPFWASRRINKSWWVGAAEADRPDVIGMADTLLTALAANGSSVAQAVVGDSRRCLALVDEILADGGDERRLAVLGGLEIGRILHMIRSHSNRFGAWRSSNGRNIFHDLVGLRGETRAIVECAAKIDGALLTEPDAAGLAVRDMLSGNTLVLADRLVLSRTAGRGRSCARRTL